MQAETKVCQNCKKDFTIEQGDFNFYQKMSVPPPKLCPACRAQLRLSFRNERFFYKRPCGRCKRDTISMFAAHKPYPVWCRDCWWSDDLDALQYGREYDPLRPFFEQFRDLWEKIPKPSLFSMRSVNSEYINFSADQKNCYMVIESSNDENCINCYWIQLSKDLVDCSFTNKVELSYEVDDCYDSNGLRWSKGCHSCLDSSFLIDCRGCTSCLGCINLRGQKYHIFNQAYTKEEYKEKLQSFRLDTYSGARDFKNEFAEFIKDKPRKFAEVVNIVNSTGNYLNNVKNCRECFHCYQAEDCAYSHHAFRGAKDCQDCHTVGRSSELVFNSLNMGIETGNIICSSVCWGSQFMTYCINCPSSQHCFGCVGLIKGQYCILNKWYSKADYEKLRAKIIAEMQAEGIYGGFFPKNLSPLGYNESSAMDDFPLNREEALAQGFTWEDAARGTYDKETVDWKNFPDSIEDLPKDFDVSREIFVCTLCRKNYRIIQNELLFYKKLSIPLPRLCPDCRHEKRMKSRGPNRLWHRQCMCKLVMHSHSKRCPNEFKTPYLPNHPETIYCEDCYQKEVY